MSETLVESLTPLESNVIDLSENEGKKAKIENVEVTDGTSDYDREGNYQAGLQRPVKWLKVYTEDVTEIEIDGEKKNIGASEIFNLIEKEDGTIGWSTAFNAKLQKFLKKQKAETPSDLIGTEVTIRIRTTKNGNQYLGFITD